MSAIQYIKLPFVLYNSLFWLFIMAINLSTSYSDSVRANHEFDWMGSALVLGLAYGPWMIFSPFQYGFINQMVVKARQFGLLKLYLILLFSWVPLYIAYDSMIMMWNRGITDKSIIEGMLMYPKFYWFFDTVVFTGMFGGYLAIVYYRNAQAKTMEALTLSNHNTQLKLRLSELKMQALQAQLDPHFLFNALDSISSLVRIADKKQALNAIRQLSDLLRFAVAASPRKMVDLTEELQFTQDYIELQKLRFGERLMVDIHCELEQQNIQIPPYILQTLVENAIVHNLEKTGEPVAITIDVSSSGEQVSIDVTNSIVEQAEKSKGLGVGLENLRNRLTLLFEDNFKLNLNNLGDKFSVRLDLPLQI